MKTETPKRCRPGKYLLAAALMALMGTGCGQNAAKGDIHVLSRESGSGTQSAFNSQFDIEKVEPAAEITSSTAVVMQTVANDTQAIGYLSMGSLTTDAIKDIAVDGVRCNAETIQNGTYPLVRPFLLVEKDTRNTSTVAKARQSASLQPDGQTGRQDALQNPMAELNRSAEHARAAGMEQAREVPSKESSTEAIKDDFLAFIESQQGCALLEKAGYVAPASASHAKYASRHLQGELCMGGSSSMAPVAEVLAEAYEKENPDVRISVEQSDSTTGIANTADGTYDLGMSSRDLSQEEKAEHVSAREIALDGIVLVVHPDNPVENLDQNEVKDIYEGTLTNWKTLR